VVWHYLVHVTVKGGPLFFSLWFFFLCNFSLPHGASCSMAYRCIRLLSSSCVPVCFFFPFPLSECLLKARRHLSCFFTFGVWPVGFAWSSEEKKTFFVCGILLSIVVLGICDPNRARFNF
jgi:hypothetical protein